MLAEFNNDTRVVHCRKEPYDVYIGRPSEFGNPFTHISDRTTLAEFVVRNREEAIARYREWLLSSPEMLEKIQQLRGKVLGCWCNDSDKCHGKILADLANLMTTHRNTPISAIVAIYDQNRKSLDNSSQSFGQPLF